MCQFCNQPDYITCNCQPLEPLCDQCADNSDCYPGRDLACEVYHFDGDRPSKLRNLRLPNGTTGEQFVEAVEAYINGLNTPLIGVDSASIITTNAGIKGHVVRMDVVISTASGNTAVIEEDGLFVDDFPEFKIKVNELDEEPGYLADKISGTTDALNIIKINTTVIDGLLHLSPSTDVAALTSSILNEGDMISSLISTLLNNPTFFDKLLTSMINNITFMNALVQALFNNPTFIENFTNVLRNNPNFFLGFFDIIGNNPDILAKFCELLYNCPNCFCDSNTLVVETVGCDDAEYTGDFVVGTASAGSITIPVVISGAGILNVTVTVTGGAFSGSINLVLDETSTEVTVPINYTGAGPAGSYPLTVSFTGATEPVDPCVVNVEVTSVPVAPTLNIFARVPLTGNQMTLQVQKVSGPATLTVLSRYDNTVIFDGLWATNYSPNPAPIVNPSYGTLTKEDVVLNVTPYRQVLESIPFYLHTYIDNVQVNSQMVFSGNVYPQVFSAATLTPATKLEFLAAFIP